MSLPEGADEGSGAGGAGGYIGAAKEVQSALNESGEQKQKDQMLEDETMKGITTSPGGTDAPGGEMMGEDVKAEVATEATAEATTGATAGFDTGSAKGETLNAANLNVTAGNVNIGGNTVNGNEDAGVKGATEAVQASDESDDGAEGDDFNVVAGSESFKDRLMRGMNVAMDTGTLEDVGSFVGGLSDDINTIMDGFYVTPPDDTWKQSSQIREEGRQHREEKRKEHVQHLETNFVNNPKNMEYMMNNMQVNGMGLMEYSREMNKGKSETYIKDFAMQRAQQELEKMKGYAAYGMDAEQAYPLYQDQKNYGLTQEEAIRNSAGFDRFDANIGNINFTNSVYSSQGVQVERVSELAPNAKDYYTAGYTDVKTVLNLDKIQKTLDCSAQKAMNVYTALEKKGKIECTPQKPNESAEKYQERQKACEVVNNMFKK